MLEVWDLRTVKGNLRQTYMLKFRFTIPHDIKSLFYLLLAIGDQMDLCITKH